MVENPGVGGRDAEEPGVVGREAEDPGVVGLETEKPGVVGQETEEPGVVGREAEEQGVAEREVLAGSTDLAFSFLRALYVWASFNAFCGPSLFLVLDRNNFPVFIG